MRRLSIAPMMECTDRHYRRLMRLITPHSLLYTEMVTAQALKHADPERFLTFNPEEHPVALQLGGSTPKDLALASQLGESFGYDEINLNVGCPSSRVQAGRFGACLMKEPELVAECIYAMREAVSIPVTVKTRLGVDDFDSDTALYHFIECVQKAGCETFILHARKAWLKGLSPKENRDIPPLQYDRVYRLKQLYPSLEIIINGGIKIVDEALGHLQNVDGVMIGREAYSNPYFMADLDAAIYTPSLKKTNRSEVVSDYLLYVSEKIAEGVPLRVLIKPLMGLFQGLPGAKQWRRFLSVHNASAVRLSI